MGAGHSFSDVSFFFFLNILSLSNKWGGGREEEGKQIGGGRGEQGRDEDLARLIPCTAFYPLKSV